MARRSLIPLLFPAAMLPVVAANGVLIYFALETRSALVDAHPFEDGRVYNRALEMAAAQDRLGWTAELEGPGAATGPVVFVVADRDGAPVGGLDIQLRVRRPVGALADLRLPLHEAAPGRYVGAVTLAAAGQWEFDVIARRGDDTFSYRRRLTVK